MWAMEARISLKRSNKNARPNKNGPPVPHLVSEKGLVKPEKISIGAWTSSNAPVVTSTNQVPDTHVL